MAMPGSLSTIRTLTIFHQNVLLLAEHGSEDEDGIKHPFQVNERALPNSIQLGLSGFRGGMNSMAPRNAITLATMTPAMRDAAISHRLSEFPVSSGNAHRVKVSKNF